MHPILRNRKWLALYLLAWLVAGAVLTLPAAGAGLERWDLAGLTLLPLVVVYAFVCLSAWYPCRANPLPETSFGRVAVAQVASALVTTGIWLLIARGWVLLIEPAIEGGGAVALFDSYLPLFVAYGFLLYLLAAVVHYLVLAFQASSEARQRSLQLEVLAREAELEAFKTQIDPHFLFNCLNSVSSLCGSDPRAAREMTVLLGGFLRRSLELSATDLIPLSRELELATLFLEIERVRFGERLRVEQRIDPDCRDADVPALVLQPLLENALKHGVGHLVDGGTITIEARMHDGELLLAVDNPCNPDRVKGEARGIGLANVRGRVSLIYGDRGRVDVLDESDRFRVELEFPARADRGGDSRGG